MANGFLDLVGTPMLLSTGTKPMTIGTNGSGDLKLMANGSVAVTVPGAGGAVVFANALRTKQAVNDVHDTTPTAAELTTSFGNPATLGRGFLGTVDDNDGDAIGYIVWCSDASFYFLKGTKAS